MPPLTEAIVRSAKPREKTYTLTDGLGLYVEITPLGSKLWRWKYRKPDGRSSRFALGRYPDVSLLMAREKRLEAARELAAGLDPVQYRKRQRAAAATKATHTFERVAREWHEISYDSWQPGTARNILHRLELNIFPSIGHLPISEVTHDDVITVLRKIESRGAREMAHRLCANCSSIFRFAKMSALVNTDFAADVAGMLKPRQQKHFASITSDELPKFLQEFRLNKACMSRITHIAVELMLLVFVRTSELIESTWSEINFDQGLWVIPWRRMKRGRRRINPDQTDHYVYLSRQAVGLLRELHSITAEAHICSLTLVTSRDP